MSEPRRSSRVKSENLRGLKLNGTNEDSDDDEIDEASVYKRRKVSKQAKGSANRKSDVDQSKPRKVLVGRKGKLQALQEIPLDVLLEIFCHLHPLDLIHLSRASKVLRGILMRKSAASIWTGSLSNIPGIPPRPSELNEPGWASLLFENFCHECLASGASNVQWAYRTRLCLKCLRSSFIEEFEAYGYGIAAHWSWYEVLPYIVSRTFRSRRYTQKIFRKKDVEAFKEQISKLEGANESFLKERKALTEQIMEHAVQCEQWYTEKLRVRGNELEEVRAQRIDAILEKLDELGYKTEIEFDGDAVVRNALVRQAKPLTDRVWQNLKPKLIQFMDGLRAERLRVQGRRARANRLAAFKEAYEIYVRSRHPSEPIPGIADAYLMGTNRATVENTLSEVEIKPEDFRDFFKSLPKLSEQWREEKKVELLPFLTSQSVDPSVSTETRLELATAVFQCRCGPIAYPRVLAHRCLTGFYGSEFKHLVGDPLLSEAFLDLGARPWSVSQLNEAGQASLIKRAQEVVTVCGLDPKTATPQDLDDANVALEGRSQSLLAVSVMGWRYTILHREKVEYNLTLSAERLPSATNCVKGGNDRLIWNPKVVCLQCRKDVREPYLNHRKEHGRFEHIEIDESEYAFHVDSDLVQKPIRVPVSNSDKD